MSRSIIAEGSGSRWLITGVAGFIGSHLLEELLSRGHHVTGLDNFSTGFRENLDQVRVAVSSEAWRRFRLLEGDMRSRETCADACEGVDYVLHQASLGSIPRSLEDPSTTHEVNATGTLNMLIASRISGVKAFVFASSSSVYGDADRLPKREGDVGSSLSPYAASKHSMELYASAFYRSHGLRTVGLRYFNVFGARQNPDGPYAAVVPRWLDAMLTGEEVSIFGDGATSRDFCYVANVVQANILAATAPDSAMGKVFNVSVGDRTSLRELFEMMKDILQDQGVSYRKDAVYLDFRPGDVRHSQADVTRAERELGYSPTHVIRRGMEELIAHVVRGRGQLSKPD